MFKVAIIEDEKKMADALRGILKTVAPDCSVIAQADSISRGLQLFETYKIDIAFCDVELKDGLSFDLLKQLEQIDFQVIFVTAYSHYAVTAFNYSAVDYIVKPADPESVLRAVERAKKNISEFQNPNNLQLLLENINRGTEHQKIVLQTADANHYVAIKDIVRCESENNYCNFFLLNGDKILVSRPLKEFEKLLPTNMFFRIHQSHLVNISYIRQVKKKIHRVILTNGDKIPLASRRKDELLAILKRA